MSEQKIVEVDPGLNSEEKKALGLLRDELGRLDGNVNAGVSDSILSRFLRMQSWDVTKALASYTAYLQWRKDQKIDNVLNSQPPKIDIVKKLFSYNYHGADNEGRPIYWERTGMIHVQGLLKHVPPEEFVWGHIWGMENLARMCEAQSKKLGKRIDQFTTVLDLTGLSLGHRAAIPYVAACTDIDNKYYPEALGKLYIINAPWIMPVLYQLVAVFLDEATKSRVEILSGDPRVELPKHIPRESLPVEYGGACDCKGGCIPIADASELLRDVKTDENLEHKNVAAGSAHDITLACGPDGGTFTWYFHSEGDYDIGFSVQIIDRENPVERKTYAKPPSRVVTAKGSYTAKGECKLVLNFDNTFSWMTSKDVRYITAVAKVDLSGFEGKTVSASETREEEQKHGRTTI